MVPSIKWLPVLVLLLVFTLDLNSQSVKAFEKAGDKAISLKENYAAMVHYAAALEIEPDNSRLQYKYAEVSRQFNAFEIALEYYQKVEESPEKLGFPDLYYRIGEVQKQMGDYTAAKESFLFYQSFKSTDRDPVLLEQAKAEVNSCAWAIKKKKEGENKFRVLQLGKQVNTSYSEFAPLVRGDTLYYTSYRYVNNEDKHDPPRRISKVLNSIDGEKGRPLRRKFNISGKSTAHLTYGLNGDRVYFTVCDYVESGGIRCAIHYREKNNRGYWESTSTALPEEINLAGFSATQPSIAKDPFTEEERLYFVSDRASGQGGMDIWYTVITEKDFSNPVNLETINTPSDEATPYYLTSERKLFFSSRTSKDNFGGYDVFQAVQEDSATWSAPQNLGYPINSSYNDLYYYQAEGSEMSYLSSNREGSFYIDRKNKACCNDIYLVQPIKPEEPEEPTVDIPVVIQPPIPEVPPLPTKLEDFLPLALYFDNDEPDRRTRRTTTKKNYEDTYFPYYARRNEYLSEYTEPLDDEELILQAEERMDVFFEDNVKKGYDFLWRFSEILLERLKAGDKVEIFVKGFTSPRAKSDYNDALGKRRVSCVRNHFETYESGIFLEYIKSGQLIISEKSFGETTAQAGISDELEDLRNSVYSVEAALERRVELVEIKQVQSEEEDQ